MRTSGTVLAAMGMLLAGALPALPDNLAVDFASSANNEGQTNVWNLGFEFLVNNTVEVTALGAYNSPDLGWGGEQNVGLWDADGNLLASTFVNNTDVAVGNWYFHAITPIPLTAGQDYVVGAQGGTNLAGFLPINVNPSITYVEDQFFNFEEPSPLNPLTEPVDTEGLTSTSNAGFFGGNLELAPVPEPSSLMLLGTCLLGTAWRLRRRLQR